MVWIHGGGFLMGSGSEPMYDGTTFARRGDVVFVSLNYRLADLGFLHLAHLDESYAGSGNNGILDQVAALEWVRDNIAALGGDPGNVTIFGESAGGMSVGALLVTPRAQGLFHKAIAQSGAVSNVIPDKLAAEVTDDFMGRLGVTTVDELLEVSTEQLLEKRAAMVAERLVDASATFGGEQMTGAIPWQPVQDGTVIPDVAIEAIRGGSAQVPLLVGTNRDEWKLFSMLDAETITEEVLQRRTRPIAGDATEFVDAYRAENPDLEPKDVFTEMASDLVFRVPAIRLAEAQLAHQPVWMYLFDWKSRAFGGALGACHAMELPFVFNTVAKDNMALFLGDGPIPAALADQIQDAWIAFAHGSNPNHAGLPDWPAYDTATRPTMQLAEPCEVVEDPLAAARILWETV